MSTMRFNFRIVWSQLLAKNLPSLVLVVKLVANGGNQDSHYMSNFFFSGSSSAKLDSKNRFVLPQSMRFGLVENGALEFSLALGLGGCLAIYRKSDIERIVAKFKSKQHVGQYQKFFTLFFSTLHQTTCDKVGRVIIPPLLKKAVEIKSDIIIAGVLDKIEIWPKERYEQDLQSALSGKDHDLTGMIEDAFSLLEEKEEICEQSNQ